MTQSKLLSEATKGIFGLMLRPPASLNRSSTTSFSVFSSQLSSLRASSTLARLRPVQNTRLSSLFNANSFSSCSSPQTTLRELNPKGLVSPLRAPLFGNHSKNSGLQVLHRSKRSYSNGRSYRASSIDPYHLTYALIGVNAVIFVAWQYATESYDYSMIQFMRNNFTLSWNNLLHGRVWTLLTFNFSHIDGFHIFMNSLNFYFFAPTIISLLGPKKFALFGVFAMLTTAAAELGHEVYLAARYNDRRPTMSLGLSGCNNAIMFLFACLFPRTPIMIYGIVPMPAMLFIGGWTAYELYSALSGKRTGISHAGHLGGGAAGLLTYLLLRFGRIRL